MGLTTALALEILAAVGLLSLSIAAADVVFLAGVGTGGGPSGAFLALARDAAVGAKRPEAGVLERLLGVVAVAGVLGRAREGVLERAGVKGIEGREGV